MTFALLPEILLVLFACALLFVPRQWALAIFFAGLVFTGVALARQYVWVGDTNVVAFSGALIVDRFSLFFDALFLITAALVGAVSGPAIAHDFPEYLSIMLLAQSGMFCLAGGTDLITIFLGLELMALSFYILAGFKREDRRSSEAALKFLILGAFSSGLVVYGFSLLFAISGSTRLSEISNHVSIDPLLLLAIGTAGAGLLFKIAAVPFHM